MLNNFFSFDVLRYTAKHYEYLYKIYTQEKEHKKTNYKKRIIY